MDIYYVYVYLREDGTPYYIGKGKRYRAFSKHRRVKPPTNASRIVFLFQDLSEGMAFDLEKYFIRLFGRIDLGTGCLRNMTDGGEGVTGHRAWNKGILWSEEVKQKFSMAKIGKKQTPEHIAKRAKTRIGYVPSDETKRKAAIGNLGKIVSVETKNKQRASRLGKEPWNKGKTLSKEYRSTLSIAALSRNPLAREKYAQSKLGRFWVNNGFIEKLIDPREWHVLETKSFQRGRIVKH